MRDAPAIEGVYLGVLYTAVKTRPSTQFCFREFRWPTGADTPNSSYLPSTDQASQWEASK